nr:hypothetical protein [uncultured Oscillibacter sp.]
MDYLGWELERQGAALRALLGGGSAKEGGAPLQGGGAAEDGRRSPAGLGNAGEGGSREAGRYAGGRGETGIPPVGGPGAWEMLREAGRTALGGGSGGLPAPGDAWEGFLNGEGLSWEGRSAETHAPESPRQRAPEETRALRRGGTGAAEPQEPSGGREPEKGPWETAAGSPEETEAAAGGAYAGSAPGENRAAGEIPRLGPGGPPLSGENPGGRESPHDRASSINRGVPGKASPGSPGLAGRTVREERLPRSLPWGTGRESPALRAEDGARALSRAVQRDARRYDGGFSIY